MLSHDWLKDAQTVFVLPKFDTELATLNSYFLQVARINLKVVLTEATALTAEQSGAFE